MIINIKIITITVFILRLPFKSHLRLPSKVIPLDCFYKKCYNLHRTNKKRRYLDQTNV